jgi:hypothetical protein
MSAGRAVAGHETIRVGHAHAYGQVYFGHQQ